MGRTRSVSSGRRWSDTENAILVREWGALGPMSLLAHLPGRTWAAIYLQAEELDLLGRQRLLTVRQAALRLGYTPCVLRRVLKRQGVHLGVHWGAGRLLSPAQHAWRTVDWDAAVAAVVRDLALETCQDAARRWGLAHPTLHRWLVRAGVMKTDGARAHLDPAKVDEVVRAQLARTGRGRRPPAVPGQISEAA